MLIEQFDPKAKDAAEKACQLAQKKQQQVTPLHLIYGLIEQAQSVAKKKFKKAGIQITTFINELSTYIDDISKTLTSSENIPPSSTDLKRVFNRAQDLADEEKITVSHLLLSLLQEDELEDFECITEKVQTQLREILENTVENEENDDDTEGEEGEENLENEYLKKYTLDLTQMAKEGKLEPVIGRDSEIRQVIQVLSRRLKNNPVIIGEPGVGKTAVVEGLAQRIAAGEVPDKLKSNILLNLDLGLLVAGTKFRGEFEERLKMIIKEISASQQYILFIDEIHTLIGAGGTEGAMDASNLLKPSLARGEIRCIGATTLDEFRKRFEKDAALTRRFQKILVEEPTCEEAIAILRGLKDRYEVYHGVRILDNAIIAAAKLSKRYIMDRYLPDKAIDLIDETGARIQMDISTKPEKIEKIDRDIIHMEVESKALEQEEGKEFEKRLKDLQIKLKEAKEESKKLTEIWQKEIKAVYGLKKAKQELEEARKEMKEKIRDEDFSRVAELQYKVIPKCEEIVAEFSDIELSELTFIKEALSEEEIAFTISKWTGVPVSKLLKTERAKLMEMENLLGQRVIGQDHAIITISKAIRRARAGLRDTSRPIGSFLLLGPTGVGKTELAKALAEFMFDDENSMMRLDMSEFMEKHSSAKIIGSPPGYVGYEEGGELTEYVRRKPYSVVLFDEVEKAHPDIFNLLLQVMDDGRLSDNQGKVINFSNTIILLTSNLGANVITQYEGNRQNAQMKEDVMKIVKAHFRPEFLNRLDDTIMFNQLAIEDMQHIVTIQMKYLEKLLKDSKLQINISDEAKNLLAKRGFNPVYGARPLKRTIQKELQDPLSEVILTEKAQPGDTLQVSVKDGEIHIETLQEIS